MIVQVSATDTLEDKYLTRHTTYVQFTIKVLDVNDETPRITVVCIYTDSRENLILINCIIHLYRVLQ